MNISEDLIKFNEASLPENFVSIAVQVKNSGPFHAAILIRHQTINYLHHFPGNKNPLVEEDFNENGWYIYKIFNVINVDDENEVGAFLQFCKRICAKSNITYSFISDGSYYKEDGAYESKVGLPEFGSCVGFCINTLSNAIIDADSYFDLNEWDNSTVNDPRITYLNDFGKKEVEEKYPKIDWKLYQDFQKRISPLEYLCSGFINEYPIKKSKIEDLEETVKSEVLNKFQQSNALNRTQIND